MASITDRMIRAAKLDVTLYEEVEADKGAMGQALDYKSTWRAVGVCLIGWIVQIVIFGIFFGLAGGFGGSQG